MDSLGWDNPPAFMSTSCPWSNHQHEIGERYFVTNANYGILGGKLDLPESVFDPSPDLQRTTACNISSNSDRRSELIQQLAPVLDSMNGVYNLDSSQCQEALAGTTWGEALMAELCSSPHVNRQYNINPSSGAVADGGTAEGLQVVNGVEDGEAGVSKAGSFESLDCLLSAANSNTDTSVEDDGISLILSDRRTLWNFGSSSAVSSGESENNGSNGNSKNVRRRVKEPDEAVSQSSLNSPKFNKRKKDQQERKVSANYHYFDLHHSNSSTTEGGFQLISENPPKSKKPRLEKPQRSSNINFQQPNSCLSSANEPDAEAIAHMKEMIYRAAAFRPVNLGLELVEKTKRKNVRISSDPQTVAARHRRERISERIRVLQRLVPGGSKMDTATMLDEAANYLKFLRSQVQALETQGHKLDSMICTSTDLSFPSPPFRHPFPMQSFFPLPKP